jgi:hypothetical protein
MMWTLLRPTGLTDGSNDKKCDLVAVVGDTQRVILAQGYMSAKGEVVEAPANKPSDLNTAASWLLAGTARVTRYRRVPRCRHAQQPLETNAADNRPGSAS